MKSRTTIPHGVKRNLFPCDAAVVSREQGGKGVVLSGCPACKKRINTMTQFLDHLTNDVMPELIDRLSAATNES